MCLPVDIAREDRVGKTRTTVVWLQNQVGKVPDEHWPLNRQNQPSNLGTLESQLCFCGSHWDTKCIGRLRFLVSLVNTCPDCNPIHSLVEKVVEFYQSLTVKYGFLVGWLILVMPGMSRGGNKKSHTRQQGNKETRQKKEKENPRVRSPLVHRRTKQCWLKAYQAMHEYPAQ